jgi:hypothetical protein
MKIHLLLIVVLVVIWYINQNTHTDTEQYYHGMRYQDIKYCKNCGRNSKYIGQRSCKKCSNCGWCIKRDKLGYLQGECVEGTRKGPFFREDCRTWIHKGDCKWGPECRNNLYDELLEKSKYIYNYPYYPNYNKFRVLSRKIDIDGNMVKRKKYNRKKYNRRTKKK